MKIIQKEQEENQLATTKRLSTIDLDKLKQDLVNQQVTNQNQQFHVSMPQPLKTVQPKSSKKK